MLLLLALTVVIVSIMLMRLQQLCSTCANVIGFLLFYFILFCRKLCYITTMQELSKSCRTLVYFLLYNFGAKCGKILAQFLWKSFILFYFIANGGTALVMSSAGFWYENHFLCWFICLFNLIISLVVFLIIQVGFRMNSPWSQTAKTLRFLMLKGL